MSSSMALRRSPKPGALTAATFSVPRSLLTTRVGERLALDVLGDDERGACRSWRPVSSSGQQVLHRRDLLLVDEDVGVLEDGFHALGVGDEVGREVAAVELHALDDLELRLDAWRSSTVMTPSLPTLSMASAMMLPIVRVPVGGDGADLARSCRRRRASRAS